MISREGDLLRVSGPLTMDTVRQPFDAGLGVERDGLVKVDLSAVSEVDSSAVSLLLAWVRDAERRGGKLQFLSVPENLLSLAKMYGVDDLIPFRA
jgi:phospholipid transport system transporter-binding protein